MEKKLSTLRAVAAILAVALVIAIIVIINDHSTITGLKASTAQNLTAQRDVIREDCAATDPASVQQCATDLQGLSDLLGQFSKNMHAPTTTPLTLPKK